MHIAVYPTLPPSPPVPNDSTKYPYVKVKLENGRVMAVGLPWIDPATVVIHSETQARFTVSGVTAEDIPYIRDAILAAGYNQLSIEIR